ncbi:hypothetical protein SH449x_001705 [Pirellulaceae bacterium SH449]
MNRPIIMVLALNPSTALFKAGYNIENIHAVIIGSLSQAKYGVGKFVSNNILQEITGQTRNRKFMYQSYIELFRDEAQEVQE